VTEEAVVGDRHPVRVAPEVLEDLGGASQGPFRVHDPGVLPKLLEPGGEGAGLGEGRDRSGEHELAGREGAPESVQVLAAEDLRESADREEKAGRRGDPARAVLGERAAGDNNVQMQVLGEILAQVCRIAVPPTSPPRWRGSRAKVVSVAATARKSSV